MNLLRLLKYLYTYLVLIHCKKIAQSRPNNELGPTIALNTLSSPLPRTHELQTISSQQEPIKQSQKIEGQKPKFRLVTIDINDHKSTDRVNYSFNATSNTHIFTAKGINLIKRVREGDKVLWDSGNKEFANEVTLKYNENGQPVVRIHSYGDESPQEIMAKLREEDLKHREELQNKEDELNIQTEVKNEEHEFNQPEKLPAEEYKEESDHPEVVTEEPESIISEDNSRRVVWKPRHAYHYGKPLSIPDSTGRISVKAIFPEPKNEFIPRPEVAVREEELIKKPEELIKEPEKVVLKGEGGVKEAPKPELGKEKLAEEAKKLLRSKFRPEEHDKHEAEETREELVKELEQLKEQEKEIQREIEEKEEEEGVKKPKIVINKPKTRVMTPVIVPKKREQVAPEKLVGIPLNITSTESTDKYTYSTNDCGDVIFSAKLGYGFNVVSSNTSRIWSTKDKTKYADFVDIYDTGFGSKDLTIFMMDRTVERYRKGVLGLLFTRQDDKKEFGKFIDKKYYFNPDEFNKPACNKIICKLSFGLLMCC